MRIHFSLFWNKPSQPVNKAFKQGAAFLLFQDYFDRISRFVPCEAGPYVPRLRGCLWVCEREKKSKAVSAEALAGELQKVMNSGTQVLQVLVGGPDGFTSQTLEAMRPSFRWSFGPLTLPHELAAVVAVEQIYRALTILKNTPYHYGH
ncbi:MAG: 23S rRNA (pseudouridine(1915)-N(3))-methyltransferase RlmH [Candidatus Omnitrophica bacterium]|nr:23S rRNA (pseudouridine(1915)-N(3))-methyltransferase RlmH [Candidatus Omnitrophota bacterium]